MMPHILKESAKGWEAFRIEDTLLQERVIFLTEEVNAETSCDLIKQLMYLEYDDPGKEITFCINSPGGEVTGGLAVYDYIRMLSSPVRTVCLGTAASMGAILFLAGDQRDMLPHTRIMIHDPSYSGGSYSGKKPMEIEEELNNLKQTQEILCKIISERTGQPLETIYEKTQKDSYFYAEEALEFGLATQIISSADALHRKGESAI